MRVIHWIALVLVIIGALNWGVWGIFQINPIALLFKGPSTAWSRIIFTLVGLAGLWCFSIFKILATCDIKRRK